MDRVTHYDGTNELGVRFKSIGAGYNDMQRAYNEAIEKARRNQNFALAAVLEQCSVEAYKVDMKALDAICDLQD
jgi:hypothetical protein